MKKTQFFSDNSVEALQQHVNAWLGGHKDIGVIHSGMTAAATTGATSYSFYILYESLVNEAAADVSTALAEPIPAGAVLPGTGEIHLQ